MTSTPTPVPPRPRLGADDVLAGARFLAALPRMLWWPVRVPRARDLVRARIARRAEDFVGLVRRAVFAHSPSPYRTLLRAAGCEAGDVERLVMREGLEGALGVLFRQGVYLTVDELKGRRPVVRGTTRFHIEEGQLRNPLSRPHLLRYTSGSRGAAAAVAVNLGHVRDCAVDTSLAFAARGSHGWRHAVWTVPGSSAIVQMAHLACFGARPERCFLQVDPRAPGLHARYAWSTRALRWASVVAGAPLPAPELATLDDPGPVARWMAATRRAGAVPHLVSFVSPAILLCRAARAAGLDLGGGKLTVGGEPLTPARRAALEGAGLEVMSGYASTEAGGIATECLAPGATDDLHVQLDRIALIQPGDAAGAGLPADALLATAFRDTAPTVLINASLGDQACLDRRACGCPLAELGWTLHASGVRSFEKLTAGGMTFHDTDVARVLDEVLPARFGGGPTDYQLVEAETSGGEARMILRVHPAVPLPAEGGAVVDAFLGAIGGGSGAERVMALQWRQAGVVSVERAVPVPTATGKILHLQARSAPLVPPRD